MTDHEAIEVAKRASRRYGAIIHIPPTGVINEIVTVDLRDWHRPVVTRAPTAGPSVME